MDTTQIKVDINHLSIKEIIARLKGILTFSDEEHQKKDTLLSCVLADAPQGQIKFLQEAGQGCEAVILELFSDEF
jgi:hypothetical protein